MAAGNVTVLNVALAKILSPGFDFENQSFGLVLTTKDQPLTAAFTGSSGEALYSDLTEEVVGTGYTAGGAAMTGISVTLASAVAKVSADPVSWDGADFTAKYGVICLLDGSGYPAEIVAFADLETTSPDGRTSSGGDLIVNFSAGLFDLQRA